MLCNGFLLGDVDNVEEVPPILKFQPRKTHDKKEQIFDTQVKFYIYIFDLFTQTPLCFIFGQL